jgi:hypothetical protein
MHAFWTDTQKPCLSCETGCSIAAVFRKLGLALMAVALFAIGGGHWAVLQTVAWAEMLRDYTQRTGSVAVAVEQTFDGRYPCDLCREIATAKAKEHQESPAAPGAQEDVKAKALVADRDFSPPERVAAAVTFPASVAQLCPSRTEQPPTPPPRRRGTAA